MNVGALDVLVYGSEVPSYADILIRYKKNMKKRVVTYFDVLKEINIPLVA